MESRRNGPQLSSRHDDDDDVTARGVSSFLTAHQHKKAIHVMGMIICTYLL